MLLLFLSTPVFSQNRKARRYYEQANNSVYQYQYAEALNYLFKTVEEDSLYFDAWQLMGDIYLNTGDKFRAVDSYRNALKCKDENPKDVLMVLAKTELSLGQYAMAGKHFQEYEIVGNPRGETKKFLEQMKERVSFALNAIDNPVPFDPQNLGNHVNTPYDDYINAISVDDSFLMFTIKAPQGFHKTEYGTRETEDFYISYRDVDGAWQKAVNLGPPVNTPGNEGALTLSPDGRYIFFAGCDRRDNTGRCDLYFCQRKGNSWSEAMNLGTMVNSAAWESQPAVSSDGKTIFFASNREGGLGQTDLWQTKIMEDGTLTKPVNMGDVINTPGSEMAPFIHPDGNTLYFSSDGHIGMGGKDLFISRKINDTTWSKPQNLGYPINTWSDEMTLIVGPEGKLAYFSSDKLGGEGRYDIYAFNLYKEAQPESVTYLKGKVFDEETGDPLQADFVLTEINTGKERISSFSDASTGEFLVTLPGGCDYVLTANKEGYLYYSDRFYLKDNSTALNPYQKDVPLTPIKEGKSFSTRNIFFDTDKYVLKDESIAEIRMICKILNDNPDVGMEIIGHTDDTGSEEHNLKLSENRASSVYEKLVEMGIDASRLSFKGLGSSKPVDSNDTEAGRANNRRTEFVIR
jgi:outer membrane protein OmpA-like peptidoglycan-associated protein